MAEKHPSERRHAAELRERAVRMARDAIAEQGGQSFGVVTRVARQLGVGPESLRNWLKQADVDDGRRPGTSTEDAWRIIELEREVRDFRRGNWKGLDDLETATCASVAWFNSDQLHSELGDRTP